MKKLQLNLQHLQNVEVLTRSQLKKVLGGDPPVTGGAGGSSNGCIVDPPPCSVVVHTESGGYSTFYGNCGLINGRCKCVTEAGDYQTGSDTYGCEVEP